MKAHIYSIFDSCAGVYQKPFVGQSDGEVIRSFGDIAKDESHPIGQHPEHYSLWRIGSFNDADGQVIADEHRECIITALVALAQNQPIKGVPE